MADFEEKMQKITDMYIVEVEKHAAAKEKDLMEI